MKDSSVTVTEGINTTFPLCVLLSSLSDNLTIPLSVGLLTQDITATGELLLIHELLDFNLQTY